MATIATYIPQVQYEHMPPEFITVNEEVLQRHRVDILRFTAWADSAVPTMIQMNLTRWCETEKGGWCCEYGHKLFHIFEHKFSTDEMLVAIFVYVTPKRWTEFCLRFVDKNFN